MPKTSAFDRRIAAHMEELRQLYLGLYHGDERAFDYFITMLSRSWQARKIGRASCRERVLPPV